ncbi:MAG TPA: type II CAAX endopeptidase family protein [Nocardioides sp.]|nr:type II CAAX endopeptidase family protein [Nocardioides sp.]
MGVGLLVVLFVAGQVVLGVFVTLWLAVAGDSSDEIADKLSGDTATPSYLALVNLGWAAAIPAVLLVAFALHRLRPGWVASVAGALRWRWLLVCLGLAVAALAVTVAASTVLPDQGSGTIDLSGGANPWSSTARDFLLVVLLLTPLQAAGEEFAFRGYLAQACGGMTARFSSAVSGTVAVVVPAVLFALAHGIGQEVPIFFDRLAFGLVAGVLVLLTGGLEAGIAMHVLNNFLAFGLAIAFGDMTDTLMPSDGTWWSIPVTLVQSLSYLALTLAMARRMGVQARTEGAILEARRARV